jgi:site-specific DNA recombinase
MHIYLHFAKSSEEGLEQNFNSLDAQREACEAFIASQKHEGWQVLPELYDDGGFSGATMERPALQWLLLDVTAGKIDVVVVYKVDRLTRSLSDFAKIVETFDQRKASFVSVTQQFNTTSSMGRLTLNILLSFAQFEREVTGERIRDKIAASKKKGMWMGGQPSLGYDVKDKKLIVNKAEAETVRHIFRRYIELKSVRLLKADLDATVSSARPARLRTAVDMARNRSPGARSTSCCRTASTGARRYTRTRTIPASMKPLSTRLFGTRCRRCLQATASIERREQPTGSQAFWPESCSTRKASG